MTSYTLPDLPYDYGALEPHLSGAILELHHGKHHASYVKGANETLDKLEQARAKDDFAQINQLEKNLAFHVSGHVLHSLLWKNMTPEGGGEPSGELERALSGRFGSVDACRKQMTAAAAAIQGSGWAALAWEPYGRRLVIEQVYDHQGNVGNGSLPILVIDMWEHAYYLQYKNRKAEWLGAFWKIVNWDDVARRLAKVRSVDIGL
jgi:Fe-Mn family superoxide dismutase